jgi:hypothetical protein
MASMRSPNGGVAQVATHERRDEPPRRQRCREQTGEGEPDERGAIQMLASQPDGEQREEDGQDQHGDEVCDRQGGKRHRGEHHPAAA